MENKKNVPATQQPIQQQHMLAHHVHPPASGAHPHLHNHNHNPVPASNRLNSPQPYQIQPNGIVHQLLMQNPSAYQTNLQMNSPSLDARSPLLDNQQELYGTRQPVDHRHYGANDNYHYQKQDTARSEHRNHNINQDIMHAVPKGYNAEVYQDYMKRNPPKDPNQIYQNHQSSYQSNISQYTNKPYLPYTNRIQSAESNTDLLKRQYNEIQQMKLRQQMRYQTEAQMQQQQTFAERQLLLQQMHGVQPPPNLQQNIYSDGHYKDSDRYHMMSQQSEREERFQPQSPSSTYQSQAQAKQGATPMSPGKSSGDSSSPSVKSPASGESRRSSGGTQALRSPIAQRPASAPVTMSGMLYKQGSDGLKVWRKRWFVLAEYCLFYYKSQDEEKLLGSVLLPSYKVSACLPEDRVPRKFAFKLEHANMRTYVLAAPDQQQMVLWVKALTLAALMQDTRKPNEKLKQTDRTPANAEKEEETEESAGPTYANAPPKPRRSNDGYGSPTPDIYDPNYDILQKPASHYSQGANQNRYTETNQNRYPESSQNRYTETNQSRYTESNQNCYPETNKSRYAEPNQNRYPETNQATTSSNTDNYDLTPQSPQYSDHYGTKRSYDAQALSLPLTNTSSDRLEHTSHASASYRNDPQPSHYDNRARSYQQQQQHQRQQDQKSNDERLNEQIYGRNQTQSLLYTKEKGQSEMPREMDLQNRNYRSNESGNDKAQLRAKETQKADADAKYSDSVYGKENYAEKPNRVGNKAPSTERLAIERRTPDAYGRSPANSGYSRGKTSDYEDIYPSYSAENEYGMSYSKPSGPPALAEKKTIPPTPSYQPSQPADYSANYSTSQNQGFSGPSVLRRKKMQSSNPPPSIQRPHSADFLEYESKNELFNKTMPARTVCEPAKQPQRPKSSLDINSYYDPSSDRYYSEESYAEKMRQSAQYLQQRGLSTRDFQVPLAKYTSGLAQKQLDSAYAHNLNNNYESSYDPPQTPKDNISYNSRYSELEALNCNWTLKEKSALESQKEYLTRTGSAMSDGSNMSLVREAMAGQRSEPAAEGFMRSASARLPSTAPAEEGKDGEKKVQQREESMKRLLEWKQRMLQSPLTRKSTPASISLARSLNQSRQASHRASEQYKNKASTYTNASYNSYSSDDEDQPPDIEPRVRRETQAGRSQIDSPLSPRVSQVEHPPPLPQRYATEPPTALNTRNTSINTTATQEAAECTYENITCTSPSTNAKVENSTSNNSIQTNIPSHEQNVQIDASESNPNPETDDSEAESEKQMEYTDDDLDEVLYQSDTELKKNLPKTEIEIEEPDESKNDEEMPETPPANSQLENHYLPMSPRKTSSCVEPAHQNIIKSLSVFDDSRPAGFEDNPYVEMSLGNEFDEMQAYEIVCVNNGKVEPVYMELNNLSTNDGIKCSTPTVVSDVVSNFADTKDLTLKRSGKEEKTSKETTKEIKHKNVSDCSDADDESSKDISLNKPFNRFSISDTFRPASYYLRGSRHVIDNQDSSDSEIMTPPPIPPSKPGTGEFGDDLSKYVMDKLDKSNLSSDNSILKLLQSEENNKFNTVKRKTTSLMIYGSRHSIHDTLFRGEKIRHSRASLSNDTKSKENDLKNSSLLSSSFLQHYNSNRSIETDSLMSYSADRGSSRMSIDSDVSSKFDRTPSNMSSERTSLNESDAAIEFRNPNMTQQEIEKMMKRRPLSDDSFFEMDSLESSHINEAVNNVDLDRYLDNLQSKPELNQSTRPLSDNNLQSLNSSMAIESGISGATPTVHKLEEGLENTASVSHSRSWSTPVGRSLMTGKVEMAANISSLYKGIAEPRIRCNTGSQSSTSSVGATSTPISYYSKNYTDEVDSTFNKNLNHAFSADKIKEFEGDKIALRNNVESDAANTSSVVFHSRESSTEHSAPYYYSDLSSQEHINVLPTSHYLKNTNVNRKLNNQRRRGPLNKKNEITHIHNPIHNSQQGQFIPERPFELAAAARCVSVEFLSAADKNPEIDMKNIYEAAALKTPKIRDSMSSLHSNYSSKNASSSTTANQSDILPVSQNSSSNSSRSPNVTSTSLPLEETKNSSKSSENSSRTVYEEAIGGESDTYDTLVCEGDMLWDEDALWRDNLRRASHRHARSMDDLDALPAETHRPGRCSVDLHAMKNSQREKKDTKNKKISRNVTYVNEDIQIQVFGAAKGNDKSSVLGGGQVPTKTKIDEDDVYVSLACEEPLQEHSDEGVYEQLTVESSSDPSAQNSLNSQEATEKVKKRFEIDRENLRQWDLMSSGLMKKGVAVGAVGADERAGGAAPAPDTDSGADSATNEASVSMTGATLGPNAPSNQQPLAKKSFVGSNTSIGRSGRDNNIPVRAVSPRVRWVEDKPPGSVYGSQNMSNSQQNLSATLPEDTWATVRSPSRQSQQPVRAVSPRVRRHTDSDRGEAPAQPAPSELSLSPSVEQLLSANLTAGELLGRSHEELVLLLIQLRRRRAATHHAAQRCAAQINSIKDILGSLSAQERQESLQRLEQLKLQLSELERQYERSKPLAHLVNNMVKLGSLYSRPAAPAGTVERLERNQRLRQKVLAEQAEEQRRWAAGEAGDAEAARARVDELWALERELAAEAATLHGLRADKEAIETLLTGVRSKFGNTQPAEAPPAPGALEAELARVHAMLAHNSKKLEATVADNARLERELLSLRRALHTHRRAPAAHTPATALLEDEVARVQQLVAALQRQRQELSRAVRHLTQQSRALQTGARPAAPAQPLYAPGSAKRRVQTFWQETDLDSGECIDHGLDDEYEESVGHYDPATAHYDTGHYDTGHYDTGHYDTGHYDTGHYDAGGQYEDNMQPLYVDTRGQHDVTSPVTSDDGMHNGLGNLLNVEKQEIKTVRIVKRESERRQRDRDRVQPSADWPSANIAANLDHLLEEELTPNQYTRSTSLPRTPQYRPEDYYKSRNQPPSYLQLSNVNIPNGASMELSPKFPSSPSLSSYDYSRDISSLSSGYNRYDHSGQDRTLSVSTQFLNSPTDSSRTLTNDPLSKTSSVGSLTRNAELSPIFKSEAAKQIITEMSGDGQPKSSSLHRRQVPREKRRHYTAPHHLSAKTLSEMPSEYFSQDKMGRSLDDADMERALRAPPDVVRSALAPQRFAESTIDRLLLAPRKIVIPERYVPERLPELSPEEQKKRLEKVESIKKMLSSTPSSDPSKSPDGEERRQRQHLLQMNQILAKQVMEMSKIVAEKALEDLPREDSEGSEDRSPDVELPIYQQRDNFFT